MPDVNHWTPSPARIRVLFVDDEINVLNGLRRAMHSMRDAWEMKFTSNCVEALQMMASCPPDVVITDMRMPGMSGTELLGKVKRLYPRAVRFILSGSADSESVLHVAGVAHQYLSKPCDAAALKAAISRTAALRKLLDDEGLRERIGNVDSLPSLPQVYQDIVACLQGEDPCIGDVARIISADVVMTTMVMKLANSAYFSAKQTFRTTDRAVSFLGLNTISTLVLAHSIFSASSNAQTSGQDIGGLWTHSLSTASNARRLALHEHWTCEQAEEAFLTGVLHDLGKLVLATSVNAGEPDIGSVDDAHAAAGAYLLGLWGFSDMIVEAIAFHEAPSQAVGGFGLAGLLHIADRLAHGAEKAVEAGYLESLNLSGRLVEWQAVAAVTDA